jgi:TP901 family phage tail tape measure protein
MAVELATAYVSLVPSFGGGPQEIISQFGGPVEQASESVGQSAGSSLTSGFKKTLAIGAVVTTAVAGVGTALYGVGATFDDVVDTIRVGTGATGEALDGLVDVAKNVGQNVPADFAQIGPVIADLNTRLGLSGDQLETVASQYLEAGRILGQDIDIASTTAAFSAFGIEGENVATAMDQLFQVSQATGVGMNELASAAQATGPAMQTLGFGFQESIALIGSLDKAGLNSQQVMAGMQRGMVNLAKEGEAPAEAFRRVVGEIDGFIAAGDTASAIDLAGEVFGTKGAPQMVAALQSGTLALDDLVGAAGTTQDSILGVGAETMDAAEKFQLMKNQALTALEPIGSAVFSGVGNAMETVGPKIQQFAQWFNDDLLPAAQAIGSEIRDKVEPPLRALGSWINDTGIPALTSFGGWIKDNKDWLSALAVAVTAGVVAYKAWTLAITAWGAIQKAGIAIQTAWNVVMNANPVMLIVTAVAALAAGLVYFFTQTDTGRAIWDGFTNFLSSAWETISGAFETGYNTVSGWLNNLWDVIKTVWSYTPLGMITENWDAIMAVFSGIKDKVSGFFNSAIDAIKNIWSYSPIGLITGKWDEILAFFKGIPDKVKGVFSGAKDMLVNTGKDIITGLMNGVGSMAAKIGNFFLDKLPGWIKTPFKKALGIASPSKWFKQMGIYMLDGLLLPWDKTPSYFKAIGRQTAESWLVGAEQVPLTLTGTVDDQIGVGVRADAMTPADVSNYQAAPSNDRDGLFGGVDIDELARKIAQSSAEVALGVQRGVDGHGLSLASRDNLVQIGKKQ